jgi:transposase-like protein
MAVLERKKWDQKASAQTLGVDRKTLYRWLRAWGRTKNFGSPPKSPPPQPPPAPRPPAPEMTPEQKRRYDPPTLL